MQYVKDVNGTLVYPSPAEFAGIPNWQQHDTQLRKRDYKPLVGTPEQREGYTAEPKTWHLVEQSTTRIEPRREDPVTKEPFMEDIMEEDPETHEMKKTGERQVTRDTPITIDESYYQVDEWEYTAIPEPEPEPEPVVYYSKYQIQRACQKRGLWDDVKAAIANAGFQDSWENIIRISSDNEELQKALPDIKAAFGADTVDAVLAEAVMDDTQGF